MKKFFQRALSPYQVTRLTIITIATITLLMGANCKPKNEAIEICYNGEKAHCLLVE
jgi:hypothetical protein